MCGEIIRSTAKQAPMVPMISPHNSAQLHEIKFYPIAPNGFYHISIFAYISSFIRIFCVRHASWLSTDTFVRFKFCFAIPSSISNAMAENSICFQWLKCDFFNSHQKTHTQHLVYIAFDTVRQLKLLKRYIFFFSNFTFGQFPIRAFSFWSYYILRRISKEIAIWSLTAHFISDRCYWVQSFACFSICAPLIEFSQKLGKCHMEKKYYIRRIEMGHKKCPITSPIL